MLVAFGVNALTPATSALPSPPNQAPHAFIVAARSASFSGAPPPIYTSPNFAIIVSPSSFQKDAQFRLSSRTTNGNERNRQRWLLIVEYLGSWALLVNQRVDEVIEGRISQNLCLFNRSE